MRQIKGIVALRSDFKSLIRAGGGCGKVESMMTPARLCGFINEDTSNKWCEARTLAVWDLGVGGQMISEYWQVEKAASPLMKPGGLPSVRGRWRFSGNKTCEAESSTFTRSIFVMSCAFLFSFYMTDMQICNLSIYSAELMCCLLITAAASLLRKPDVSLCLLSN